MDSQQVHGGKSTPSTLHKQGRTGVVGASSSGKEEADHYTWPASGVLQASLNLPKHGLQTVLALKKSIAVSNPSGGGGL